MAYSPTGFTGSTSRAPPLFGTVSPYTLPVLNTVMRAPANRRLTSVGTLATALHWYDPAASPDDRWLAFTEIDTRSVPHVRLYDLLYRYSLATREKGKRSACPDPLVQ